MSAYDLLLKRCIIEERGVPKVLWSKTHIEMSFAACHSSSLSVCFLSVKCQLSKLRKNGLLKHFKEKERLIRDRFSVDE